MHFEIGLFDPGIHRQEAVLALFLVKTKGGRSISIHLYYVCLLFFLCLPAILTRTSPSIDWWRLHCPPSPLTVPSFFSIRLPFHPIISLLRSSPALFVHSLGLCLCDMCGRGMPDHWWRRGMGVSRPLQTGAKWCHAVPQSDHLSALLASTQVITFPCPSCKSKGHITKGQIWVRAQSHLLQLYHWGFVLASAHSWEDYEDTNQEKQQKNILYFWKHSTIWWINLHLPTKFHLPC